MSAGSCRSFATFAAINSSSNILNRQADIIIIGAGASGLMAAIHAAGCGCKVMLLEKMPLPARKLRITGKGRCNLTNTALRAEFMKHIGPDARFLKFAFAEFFNEDLIRFFNTLGVETKEEQGGRVFPVSDSAQEVVDALVSKARSAGVDIRCGQAVRRIMHGQGKIAGAELVDGRRLECERIILAAGGSSYPATGSDGDGFRLAETCGHTVLPLSPGLVPLETSGSLAPSMQGISLKNIQVNVWLDGKKAGEAFGEMLFTHFGLSGPVILSLSRRFVSDIVAGRKVVFSLDLKPALDHDILDARLLREMDAHGKKSYSSLLRLLMPSGMTGAFAALTGIPGDKVVNQLTAADRKKIRLLLKDMPFTISRPRGFKEAIITMGGVSTSEVDARSMESKLVSGLYLCGEVLNLDADTGGYNLQIAFSTGYIAGRSAGESACKA